MDSPNSKERPYRSHLRPACHPCRKRKSRCKIEAHSTSCLMCRVHGTQCLFPSKRRLDSTEGNANARKAHVRGQTLSGDTPRRQSLPVININKTVDEHLATIDETDSVAINTPWDENNVTESPAVHRHYHDDFPSTALSIEDTETENSHVISPVMTSDSQVLTDYLSTMSTDGCGIRLIRPIRVGGNGRVLFTAVQKRPIGLIISPNPSYTNCQIIEKLLEPWTEQLIDL